MDLKSKVCGAVILFNPEQSVIEHISSYINQVYELIVVDNSEKTDPDLVEKIKSMGNVEYIENSSNLGVAAALNIAAEIAIKRGFLYLLTMDQDSIAPKGMIVSLLEFALHNHDAGIISPLHSNKYGTHLKHTAEIELVSSVMTSGNLVPLEAYKKVGKFCEDFFIDYVDIEYCFRLTLNNYKIYQLNKVILEHNEADLSSRQLFGKTYYPHNHKPFRLYYKTRNLLYLRRKYQQTVKKLLKIEYDAYLRSFAKLILFEDQKLLKVKMILVGLMDYLKGEVGRKF